MHLSAPTTQKSFLKPGPHQSCRCCRRCSGRAGQGSTAGAIQSALDENSTAWHRISIVPHSQPQPVDVTPSCVAAPLPSQHSNRSSAARPSLGCRPPTPHSQANEHDTCVQQRNGVKIHARYAQSSFCRQQAASMQASRSACPRPAPRARSPSLGTRVSVWNWYSVVAGFTTHLPSGVRSTCGRGSRGPAVARPRSPALHLAGSRRPYLLASAAAWAPMRARQGVRGPGARKGGGMLRC